MMKVVDLRAAMRFDSGWWRRFAELGCVYGPEWWKRGSPPVIAAIFFAIARGPRGWLQEHRDAYRVFVEFARSLTESLEQWGSRPPPLVREVPAPELFRD